MSTINTSKQVTIDRFTPIPAVERVASPEHVAPEFGIDPKELYILRDGSRVAGTAVISKIRAASLGSPVLISFCPQCRQELILTGAGFRCTNCGLTTDEA